MLVRELKLRPSKQQETTLNEWLWQLTGVYNFGVKTLENKTLNPKTWKTYSKFDFVNLCAGHSKALGIPSHTLQGTLG